jgi:hypothetical protein
VSNIPLILAASSSDQLASVARYLSRASSSKEYLIFGLFFVVIAAIWTTLILWDRLHKLRMVIEEPAVSLFDELCHIHSLDRQEIAALVDAAQECQLASPAMLFVQPAHLERLGGEAMPKAGVFKPLHEKLFGNL